MANVIKTVLTYQLNGTTRDFNIPFEYLARKFVVVTLLGKDRKVLTLNTDYRFATRTTISTTKAWGQADGYTHIELRRNTSATERLVDFTDGSILRAYDLNVAQIQTMHIAEEARDLTADTIGVNNNGDLDARNRKIVNLADAVNPRDAVPLGQIQGINQNAWQARNEAQQFRNQAETFKNQAQGFRNEAEAFRNTTNQNAQTTTADRAAALQSKEEAERARAAAQQSQQQAAASQTAASNSAAEAKREADRSKTEADRAKVEADKLGNWNQLAGTVDNVTGTSVTFKDKVGALGGFVSATPDGYRLKYTNFSTILRQDANAFYILTTNKGDVNGPFNSLRPMYIDNASGWVTFGNGAGVNGRLTTTEGVAVPNSKMYFNKSLIQLESQNFTDRAVNMRVWGNASGRNNVCEWGDAHGWLMYVQRRDWNANAGSNIQLSVNGQVVANNIISTGGAYFQNGHAVTLESASNMAHYIISKDGGRNNWYVGRGTNGNNDVALHSYVHGTTLSLRQNYAQVNKHFYVGSAVVATDGNVQGTKWGGKWLDVFLNDTYIKKTKAWTQVWSGSAGGGVSVTVSQDLRFRNIWIKCANNSWNHFRTGPDGIYFIASDGGWLRFQIHSNGRGFKNIADSRSVPQAIMVENE
ncbi:tail fiber protein [Escherichia phage vB_Ec_Tarrare]|uniref:Tail fiber protein n=1 Tax=Escherichia phage vB_Ec_Tarrare TaxID=3032379 RepID=A0AAF0D4J9_9CAUD|nr:tail fiber protein [Escherichia phage vB_Ec_Tarrare]